MFRPIESAPAEAHAAAIRELARKVGVKLRAPATKPSRPEGCVLLSSRPNAAHVVDRRDERGVPVRFRRGGFSSFWLAIRSLAWASLLPGFFAGYVPWRFFGLARLRLRWQDPVHVFGLVWIGLGAALLAACIWRFAREGRGTLSPVDPPRHLVARGLYRYVRNPMYLSVTAIVLGELLLTRSSALLAYWVIWFVAVNVFVIGYEEPTLRRQFGDSYERYLRTVPRWIPAFRPRGG
jgi:protein-S-isoprenylcysteine O-methyltransferase Ste14